MWSGLRRLTYGRERSQPNEGLFIVISVALGVGPSSTDWFDQAAREAATRKQYMAMVELQYDERQLLLPLYRKYLRPLAAAMGHR